MRRTTAGSEPLPTQRNCVHAFNIHNYPSGVFSYFKKNLFFSRFPKANRDALFSHRNRRIPACGDGMRDSGYTHHTHKPLRPTSNQPHHDISHSHYDIITRGSQCHPNPSRHRPASPHSSVLKRARVRPHLYDLWKLWGFMSTVYVVQNIIFHPQETSGLLKG